MVEEEQDEATPSEDVAETSEPGVDAIEPTVDEAADDDGAQPESEHEPLPPTQDDPKTRSRLKWWLAIAAAIALIGGVGGWLYFAVWRYTPTALHHVPQGSNIVIRADAAKILLFKPVRTHIWPLLFEGGAGGEAHPRIDRIREETGVDVQTDLRELVVASMDGVAWVAVVGGNIEKGRFVAGLHNVLTKEGVDGWQVTDGVLRHRSGATIAQAEDGTLIVGSHRDIVEAALPASEVGHDLAVPAEGAIGFRLSHAAFKRTLAAIPDNIPAESLHSIDEISGSLVLSDAPQLSLEVLPKATTPASTLGAELSGMFSKLGLVLLLVPGDLYGAKSAIQRAEVTTGADTVRIDTQWPYEPLDQAVQLLAKALGGSNPTPDE